MTILPDRIGFNHTGLQFGVKDVPAAVSFYCEVLDFSVDYINGTPPEYAVVFRDNVYIHLCLPEKQKFKIGPGCGFIVVSGVDDLWNRMKSSKAEIIEAFGERDYGHGVLFRDFTIRDIDQNVLRIGEPLRQRYKSENVSNKPIEQTAGSDGLD